MTELPNEEFRQLVCLIREEKEFYEQEEKRPINWPKYNLTQIRNAIETLSFIRTEVDKADVLLLKGKAGKPLTNPKSLVKAILVCEALGLTERNAQGWLEILSPFVGIDENLDDRTIGNAYDKVEVIYLLKQIFEKTKDSDGILCGDGTGLETSRKQNYESYKKAGNHMTSIVDSREVVQALDIYESECKAMHKLIKNVYGNSLRLDAGFNDRELVKEIGSKGIIPYIFPRKNNNLNGSVAWKSMYMDLFKDIMTWLKEYHKRSHCESFHSSFKSVYGIITKRRLTSILCQVTSRIILHNRRKLSYHNA
jgi:transposase